MINEKRIKTLIIISLLLIEAFVWISSKPNSLWSLGLDDPQGPGTVIAGDGGGRSGAKKPADGGGDQRNEDQHNQDSEEQLDREAALNNAKEKGLLILVNKEHPVDEDYKPKDLAEIKYYVPDRSETTRYMRAEAAEAFHKMVDKAAEDGVELRMTTAYRSYDFQKVLFDSYVAAEGAEKANTFSAKPGQSEHQTGLAVDVSSPSVGYLLSNDYGKTKEGKWIADEAYRFGFILRFPKGKEDITGYQYEPWHLRYVGLAAAEEIHKENLTLEEYLQENNIE